MSNLISRHEAIEAIEHITSSMSVCVNTDECHGMKRMQRQAVIELANLPSAEPEIIHCKECKFAHMTYDGDCKYCDVWFPDESAYLDGDYYCASGERRTDE